MVRSFKLIRAALLVMPGPMPLRVFFLTVAMGVNHRQDKNNQKANQQDDDNRLMLPNIANEFGRVRIHTIQFTPLQPEMELASG